MRDSRHRGRDDRGSGGPAALACAVVAQLLARESTPVARVDDATVASIAHALLDPDPTRMAALRQDLRRARVSDTELVDFYFPEVARHLGCAWARDDAPFTDVTIGVARMQGMLREIGREWNSNLASDQAGATVLVVLPEGEQHTFGAVLLAGKLRRQGISVRLEFGATAAGLRKLVEGKVFDCAMISVACQEKLDQCRTLVTALKAGSVGRLWVAVGGPVLGGSIDVRSRTGADIATGDPLLALEGALAEQAQLTEIHG
jgi:methylmalonyl-CoA mutase cobalamin-binding subunit